MFLNQQKTSKYKTEIKLNHLIQWRTLQNRKKEIE